MKLSELIDKNTIVVQQFISTGWAKHGLERKPSGYCTFLKDGKIYQRKIYIASVNYICFNGMDVEIDVKIKNLRDTTAINKESLAAHNG